MTDIVLSYQETFKTLHKIGMHLLSLTGLSLWMQFYQNWHWWTSKRRIILHGWLNISIVAQQAPYTIYVHPGTVFHLPKG